MLEEIGYNKVTKGFKRKQSEATDMRKKIGALVLAGALTLSLALPVHGEETPGVVAVTVNGQTVAYTAEAYDGTAYIPFYHGVMSLRPDAVITWDNGVFTASAWDFTMTARVGDPYIVINDRYLYIPGTVKGWADGAALVPARTLAAALGAWVGWSGQVDLCSGGVPLAAGDRPYDEETLDILARVIAHESGSESLLGKLAVGGVILNRVGSSSFPNTVSGVVNEPGQFPGAASREPNAESILAARLCLEGANVAPGAYYFNGAGKSCWASRHRTYLYTIGAHAFYG